uniref:Large polyvalent protein associated domain-containing protein n=1 Tax=viral metagenome TaxID=1070528 RepID=A0A6M3IRZ5_9ZZZZ
MALADLLKKYQPRPTGSQVSPEEQKRLGKKQLEQRQRAEAPTGIEVSAATFGLPATVARTKKDVIQQALGVGEAIRLADQVRATAFKAPFDPKIREEVTYGQFDPLHKPVETMGEGAIAEYRKWAGEHPAASLVLELGTDPLMWVGVGSVKGMVSKELFSQSMQAAEKGFAKQYAFDVWHNLSKKAIAAGEKPISKAASRPQALTKAESKAVQSYLSAFDNATGNLDADKMVKAIFGTAKVATSKPQFAADVLPQLGKQVTTKLPAAGKEILKGQNLLDKLKEGPTIRVVHKGVKGEDEDWKMLQKIALDEGHNPRDMGIYDQKTREILIGDRVSPTLLHEIGHDVDFAGVISKEGWGVYEQELSRAQAGRTLTFAPDTTKSYQVLEGKLDPREIFANLFAKVSRGIEPKEFPGTVAVIKNEIVNAPRKVLGEAMSGAERAVDNFSTLLKGGKKMPQIAREFTEAKPSALPIKAEEAINRLGQLIHDAKPAYRRTWADYKAEIKKRVSRLTTAQQKARSPEEMAAATKALGGGMPVSTIVAPAKMGFTKAEADAIFDVIKTSPKLEPHPTTGRLQELTRSRLNRAMFGADGKSGLIYAGELPTMGEIKEIERVFGVGITKEILKRRPLGIRLLEQVYDIINLPRAVKASFDLSAPGRQGWFLVPAHPIESARAFKAQLKALVSDKNAREMNDILLGNTDDALLNEEAFRRIEAGLHISDIYGVSQHMLEREEMFMSRFIQNVADVKFSNLKAWQKPLAVALFPLAKGVRISERAYVTYLNKLRADVFDTVIRGWEKSGKKFNMLDENELARFVNRATGRGELGMGEYGARGLANPHHARGIFLNAMFFSPRLQMSRLQMATGFMTQSNAVRNLWFKDMGTFVGANLGIMALIAANADVTVERDPRSTDFAKEKWGDTRIDHWAGFQQYARFFVQMATKTRKAASGNIRTISDPLGSAVDLLRYKLNPFVGTLVDVYTGQTAVGEELEPTMDSQLNYALDAAAPMMIQNTRELWMNNEDFFKTGVVSAPEFFGWSTNTYDSEVQIASEVNTINSVVGDYTKRINDNLHLASLQQQPDNRQKYLDAAQKVIKESGMTWIGDKDGTVYPVAIVNGKPINIKSMLSQHARVVTDINNKINDIHSSDLPKEDKEKAIEDLTRAKIDYATQVILSIEGLVP